MVNYKNQQENLVIIGGKTHTVKSNETVKILTVPANTTAGTTCHDISDNVNYQVPTGKQFLLLGCLIHFFGSNKTGRIIQNDDIDAKASEVLKFVLLDKLTPAGTETEYPLSGIISAEKYVNVYYSNITSAFTFLYIIGVEY